MSNAHSLISHNRTMISTEVEILRGAVEFYANRNIYRGTAAPNCGVTPAEADGGGIARHALAKVAELKHKQTVNDNHETLTA